VSISLFDSYQNSILKELVQLISAFTVIYCINKDNWRQLHDSCLLQMLLVALDQPPLVNQQPIQQLWVTVL